MERKNLVAVMEECNMLVLKCPDCGSRHVNINTEGECKCKECLNEFKVEEK